MASQAVYHALKAPTDPPRADGPLKIQIASAAWDDKSLYMPNKGEFIAEWALTKLLKDKANPPQLNPVLDPLFWTLLSHIVSENKSAKHWLVPLLNRVPVAPIVSAFFQLLNAVEDELRLPLVSAVQEALTAIWPLAVYKMNAEVLLESFGTFLGSVENLRQCSDGLEKIGVTLISSLHVAASNSSNKKKLSSLLIQAHLRKWITASSDCGSYNLQEKVYVVGTEILFNVDTLRQVHDEQHPLFIALRSFPDDLVHQVLPRLFSSFVHSIRKYRTALFGQNSGNAPAEVAERVSESSLTFFDSCQSLLNAASPTILSWDARAGLLSVVSEENLFNSRHQTTLKNVVPLVLRTLASAHSAGQAALSVACLTKLMQIDYELILDDVPRVLPELFHLSDPSPSVFTFLELLLDYHIKTRTLHEHIETLFAALVLPPQGISDIRDEYQRASSTALLSPAYLEQLARSTRKFLTPTQTGHTVKFIIEKLQTYWNQFLDAESGRPPLIFTFGARLASVVLTSLPLHALPSTAFQEIDGIINDMRSDFLPRALTKALKMARKSALDSWGSQIVAAAILRLDYALDVPYSEKLWSKIEVASEDESLLPELNLELFRISLRWSAIDETSRSQGALDRILTYLENNRGSAEISWPGGSLSSGSQGRAEGALATLHMIIDRWLPTIDAIASEAQLQRLVSLLVKTNVGECDPDPSQVNTAALLLTALSSAQFWELPNLRAAVLSFADEATSILTDQDTNLTAGDEAIVSSIYQLLLTFPIEYMSRTNRSELVRRAMNADVLLSSLTNAKDGYSTLLVVRLFIHNIVSHIGPIDQPIANLSRYFNHLAQCSLSSGAPHDYISVTLSLFETHFSALLKSSEKDSVQVILEALRSCLPSGISGSTSASSITVCVVNTLTKGFTPSNFVREVQDEILSLRRRLSQVLVNQVQDAGILVHQKELMVLWFHTLCLGRWLKLSVQEIPLIGQTLCARASKLSITDPDQLDESLSAAFAILTEEFQSTSDQDRLSQLDIISASYVSFGRLVSSDGQAGLDRLLSQICSVLSLTEFSHILDLTCECLSDATHSAQDMPHLVHMAALLLSDHPPSTLKYTQNFLTNCLNIFAGHREFTDGPLRLRLEVLRLLRQQSSDSPAPLRAADMGSMWSTLSKFLSRSKEHDEQTSLTTFSEITAIISALIRLRRDLVAPTLPALALVLQQLIATIRRPRPQLGAKQTYLVTDSLPRWVDCKSPVGPDEGKALARLLEALITKTTIRNNSSTAESQRAESLARPFSKHAAYILKAYIDAMNDPLCILPSELRKELRPGLFALCSMISEHNRDAMMVSALDAGGKTIMKSLWTEYEKQKYVGKG